MIEAQGLTKRYGENVAVDNLSFSAQPGVVTGFRGPNGAGKSTTMRMILGFSLGMGQRPGIASALLGDPRTLILGEPVDGLDPEGSAGSRVCSDSSPTRAAPPRRPRRREAPRR